jgi:hypothetical protein
MDSQQHHAVPNAQARPRWFSIPAMLYPDAYVWMVFFATLDVILTALVLAFGGDDEGRRAEEINPIARAIIEHWEMAGAMAFKFALILLAIVLCEVVGRKGESAGRRLAWTCVFISAVPVLWSLALLATHRLTF